tara:strand:+ start:4083 stop:4757 length:675 start_codon:yes stop_codon:yes gene_type:complete
LSNSKPLISNLFFIKNSSEKSFYFSNEISLTLLQKKKLNILRKEYKNIFTVNTSNNFIIQPKTLSNTFKDFDLKKTIGVEKDKIEKKDKITSDTILSFFFTEKKLIGLKKNVNHIAEILLKYSLKLKVNNPIVNILIFKKKVFISITKKNKILFYNQFKNNTDDYIKYILLVFEEYNLNRIKQEINLIEGDSPSSNYKKSLDNYFVNINFNKKSIFEIITEFYE